jgi:hypothetical protein
MASKYLCRKAASRPRASCGPTVCRSTISTWRSPNIAPPSLNSALRREVGIHEHFAEALTGDGENRVDERGHLSPPAGYRPSVPLGFVAQQQFCVADVSHG